MKKIIKSRIFIVIITMIICISGTLYAAATYKASDVVYNASNGTSMNVEDALNDLYSKTNSEVTSQKFTFTSTESNLFQTKNISIEGKTIVGYGIKGISINQKDVHHMSGYNFTPAIGTKDFDGTNLTGYCYSQSNYSGKIAFGTITVEVYYQ